MADSYRTVTEVFSAEITEKKSRFIAELSPASCEEDALEFIRTRRKIYRDSRHTCSAYIIGADGRIRHSSDDGEPSGTAGKPMLALLEGNSLTDTVATVTRYFGGVLLGTGGLVRAYSGALEKCISQADIKTYVNGAKIKIEASYGDSGKLQYMLSNENITVLSSEYSDKVTFVIIVPSKDEETISKRLFEAVSGRAVVETLEHSYFEI